MITSIYIDIFSMSLSREEAVQAKKELGEKYEIKDFSNIKFILGIRIMQNRC